MGIQVSTTILISMLLLFSVNFGRAYFMTKVAPVVAPRDVLTFQAGVSLLLCAVLAPFYQTEIVQSIADVSENPLLVLSAIVKGVVLFTVLFLGQIIRKYSTSAVEYMRLMILGLVAVGNSFLGEVLTVAQMGSIAVLSVLGLYYIMRGHIAQAPLGVKGLFLLCILIFPLISMNDQYYLMQSHWWGLLVMMTITILSLSLLFGGSVRVIARLRDVKHLYGVAVFGGGGEVVIMTLLITYIPVTIGAASLALAAPIFMMVAAVYWKEGCWKQQAFIGGVSYLAALALIF